MQTRSDINHFPHLTTEKWGTVGYHKAWEQQTVLFNRIINEQAKGEICDNRLIFCEHPHVYTLGKHGKENNLLINEYRLKSIGAELVHIDRGGDITYHGPGQLVCYPILYLNDFGLGLKSYIHLLEEAVIRLCTLYHIHAERLKNAPGVWLTSDLNNIRKICAIGVRCSHFVTMHGLALNVNTDLNYFKYIHPCGFIDKGVTSIAKEIGHNVPIPTIQQQLELIIRQLLLTNQTNKQPY